MAEPRREFVVVVWDDEAHYQKIVMPCVSSARGREVAPFEACSTVPPAVAERSVFARMCRDHVEHGRIAAWLTEMFASRQETYVSGNP